MQRLTVLKSRASPPEKFFEIGLAHCREEKPPAYMTKVRPRNTSQVTPSNINTTARVDSAE